MRRINANQGFTIVEVMIVLTIGILILATVIILFPTVLAVQRDSARKSIVTLIYNSMLEYQNENRSIPGCDSLGSYPCASTPAAVTNFLTHYLPDAVDPTTGQLYSNETYVSGSGDLHTSNDSLLYIYDSHAVDHSRVPKEDQILIEIGHWCYSTAPDGGPATNPIASSPGGGPDNQVNKFVILIGQQRRPFFCIDNY